MSICGHPGEWQCTCSSPPPLLCSACHLSHIRLPGLHSLTNLLNPALAPITAGRPPSPDTAVSTPTTALRGYLRSHNRELIDLFNSNCDREEQTTQLEDAKARIAALERQIRENEFKAERLRTMQTAEKTVAEPEVSGKLEELRRHLREIMATPVDDRQDSKLRESPKEAVRPAAQPVSPFNFSEFGTQFQSSLSRLMTAGTVHITATVPLLMRAQQCVDFRSQERLKELLAFDEGREGGVRGRVAWVCVCLAQAGAVRDIAEFTDFLSVYCDRKEAAGRLLLSDFEVICLDSDSGRTLIPLLLTPASFHHPDYPTIISSISNHLTLRHAGSVYNLAVQMLAQD